VPVFMVEVQTESELAGWLADDAVSVMDSVALSGRITKSRWAHSYYLDVLRSDNRERFFETGKIDNCSRKQYNIRMRPTIPVRRLMDGVADLAAVKWRGCCGENL